MFTILETYREVGVEAGGLVKAYCMSRSPSDTPRCPDLSRMEISVGRVYFSEELVHITVNNLP